MKKFQINKVFERVIFKSVIIQDISGNQFPIELVWVNVNSKIK